MKIHILGIGGTFMGGVAVLARELGHEVSGSDTRLYPPMSTQLESHGIPVLEGYEPGHLEPAPDCVVVGNVLSRGNPAVEYLLERGLPYTSGPAFLAEHLLADRWVLAVAGTHGKTSTASQLAWILEHAGLAPGFLVGGVPENFGVSARAGRTPFFVVEADEYDTAFFDKRSKFVHYRPRTLVINNIEYDHADIFPDLESIKLQFHHLVRTVPGNGLIIAPYADAVVDDVLARGCWTPVERFTVQDCTGADWTLRDSTPDGHAFDVHYAGTRSGRVEWSQFGRHNTGNALAAVAAAHHAGVPVEHALQALSGFGGVNRRLQHLGSPGGVSVYDDFAHHPTAIAATLDGMRRHLDAGAGGRILAVFEPRSSTMKMGVHREQLAGALRAADYVVLFQPEDLSWPLQPVAQALGSGAFVHDTIEAVLEDVLHLVRSGDHVVIMSNGDFGGIHRRLVDALLCREP